MTRQAGVLPLEVSSFVDRRAERGELKRLLMVSRLVTVTGVGGVGKTRLALRVSSETRKGFADGVWWVELSALEDAGLLPHFVAEVLGLQDASLRPLEEVLADFVAARQMLLVLNTCEHLVDACAELVGRLLRAAPDLRVLATSRQPLGIIGEQVFATPPLAVRQRNRAEIADGVELFVERAQAVDPDFMLTEDNREAVVRLCRRLDGIPLAIELAAVRLRVLSAHGVLDRLGDRFRLLTGGSRVGPARHGTLQAAIAWSYELCTPAERLLWARVSTFAGTTDLCAIEEVCADDRLPAGDVLGLVVELVDKSILLREEPAGRGRYRLLDTLRAFGQEQLQRSGEHLELRRRHRDHYLRLAKRFEADWCGPDQVMWYRRLSQEHTNLRAALDFCLSNRAEHQAGLELAGALCEFWMAFGFVREGRHYLDRALALDLPPSPVLVTALWVCAWLAVAQGDFTAVEARLAQCRLHARQHGDTGTAGWIACVAGIGAMYRGDQPKAVALTGRAVELHRSRDVQCTGLTGALAAHAMALAFAGESDRAVAAAEECRAVCEQYGERWMRSYADYMRTLAELGRGEPATAEYYAREALRFKRQLGDSLGIAYALDALALAAAAGQAERSAQLLGIADRLWRTIGTPQAGSRDLRAARESCEHQARAALGDTAYQAAFDAGQAMDLDTAIAYALDENPPQPTEPSPQSVNWMPLTRREREVAGLIAQGLTNQQIATHLVIAKRTADTHVGHILTKLGFDTRAQIAAWVAAQSPTRAGKE
ncbi:ATP-binding protein [Allokutzneria albata]|uniref:Predicted ATPase n=1 Tax=Allokutzneria albata TaxID=211114 RepID=A0A1G9SVC1_ALLAB|nr:LuxR C-terminal-related transcriptional regulator [Allokutzneria albata]SDM39370.1 Predicted ATPase [Allokutzneria albata]